MTQNIAKVILINNNYAFNILFICRFIYFVFGLIERIIIMWVFYEILTTLCYLINVEFLTLSKIINLDFCKIILFQSLIQGLLFLKFLR